MKLIHQKHLNYSNINFSDGVATKEIQQKLQSLLEQLTFKELENVYKYLLKLLEKVGTKNKAPYHVDFVDNIPLQIYLHKGKKEGPLQYGVHYPNHIKIIKMSNVEKHKGTLGELIILAHEVGHALMGEKNYSIQEINNTRVMEKATDETLKMNLPKNKFPIFYEIYTLVRNTHHYKTKEGDFKEFFKDIIQPLEKEWKVYKEKNQ